MPQPHRRRTAHDRPHEGRRRAARRRHGHRHPGPGSRSTARSAPPRRGQLAEQLASAYAQQRNNAKASEWLDRAIAGRPQHGHDASSCRATCSRPAATTPPSPATPAAAVAAAEQAGRRPDEGDLLRLADAQQRTGNQAGYGATLGKLLANYPKKDYWNAYLARLPRKAGFATALRARRAAPAPGQRHAWRRPRTTWRWRSSRCRPA